MYPCHVISKQQFEAETKRAGLGYAKFTNEETVLGSNSAGFWQSVGRIPSQMNTWKSSASGRDENLFSASKVATTHQ